MKLYILSLVIQYIWAFKGKGTRKSLLNEGRFLQLTSDANCEQGSALFVHYFEVGIIIEPATDAVCSINDQIKLGIDINDILSNENIGENVVGENVYVEANVCPKPEASLRRQLAAKTAFVYRGGGGCRGCTTDNRDARRALQVLGFGSSEWFENIYSVFLEIKIRSLIQLLVAPKYLRCLGLLPLIRVEINKVSLSEVQPRILCQIGTPTPLLSPLRRSVVGPTQECVTCRSIDFSESSNGVNLRNGREISEDWKSFGLIVYASSYPSTKHDVLTPQIFDSANSTCILSTNTQKLGSPNRLCPSGGLGDGDAGAPGQIGENCNPLGNVLIIQDPEKWGECPLPYKYGSALTFDFDFPVYFQDFGLMNVRESSASIEVTYSDDVVELFQIDTFGANSVQRILVEKANVIRMRMIFGQGSVAVSEINFCTQCMAKITELNNQECIVTGKSLTNGVEFIEINDFESTNNAEALQGWMNGRIIYDGPSNFTKFLGLKNQTYYSLYKTFPVPKDAADIFVELDFYRIGNWTKYDAITIFVDGERMSIDRSIESNTEASNGSTPLGVVWNVEHFHSNSNVGLQHHVEERHHFKIKVPARSQLYYDGNLRLLLRNSAQEGSSYSGWDNIKLSARYNCEAMNSTSQQTTPAPSTNTRTPPITPTTKTNYPTNVVLKFPTSSPIVSATQQPAKSTIIESSPGNLQLNPKLAIDTPLVKLSTPISINTQSNALENIFAIRAATKSPTAKRPQ